MQIPETPRRVPAGAYHETPLTIQEEVEKRKKFEQQQIGGA